MDNVLFVVWYALFRLCLVVIHIYIYMCVEVVSFASGMINNQNGK